MDVTVDIWKLICEQANKQDTKKCKEMKKSNEKIRPMRVLTFYSRHYKLKKKTST